jgi:putative methionine-R-sulfoxide reductase with GAF domain
MTEPQSQTNSTDSSHSDIEAMYQFFMASDDLRNISQQILDLATHLTGAENCSMMLLNGNGELYVLNARGLAGATMKTSRIKMGEGVSGQVALYGNPLLVEDISSDERFSMYKRKRYRTGSFIACPITTKEKVIGVLNLNDKKTGEPFNPDDFDQAKLISLMAATAIHNFLGDRRFKIQGADINDIYQRLVEAECNNREFVARISHDIRTPLNNIKGAVYYLKVSANEDPARNAEFYEIIEKEVNYLISYLDEGVKDYTRIQTRLADIEEVERYRKLLG